MINKTQERQIANILAKQLSQEETQTTLMLALAEQYEKQLALEENQTTIMLALAEIYENSISEV